MSHSIDNYCDSVDVFCVSQQQSSWVRCSRSTRPSWVWLAASSLKSAPSQTRGPRTSTWVASVKWTSWFWSRPLTFWCTRRHSASDNQVRVKNFKFQYCLMRLWVHFNVKKTGCVIIRGSLCVFAQECLWTWESRTPPQPSRSQTSTWCVWTMTFTPRWRPSWGKSNRTPTRCLSSFTTTRTSTSQGTPTPDRPCYAPLIICGCVKIWAVVAANMNLVLFMVERGEQLRARENKHRKSLTLNPGEL